MWKACGVGVWNVCGVAVLLAVSSLPLNGAEGEPDVFANAEAVSFAVRSGDFGPQALESFVGDENVTPQTVFFAGDTVCWWTTGIVTPKGTGAVDQHIDVEVTTPRRTRQFSADFEICNTNTEGQCDDVPDFTTWTLGICVGPLPPFIDRLLQRTGPVPFDSVITGTGYESFVHSLTGHSVAPLP
jgi:hypothetical protein